MLVRSQKYLISLSDVGKALCRLAAREKFPQTLKINIFNAGRKPMNVFDDQKCGGTITKLRIYGSVIFPSNKGCHAYDMYMRHAAVAADPTAKNNV